MTAAAVLEADDLRRWRACARRFWLARRHGGSASGVGGGEEPGSRDIVAGPTPADALRASFPGALRIAPPSTSEEWTEALRRSAEFLADPRQRVDDATLLGGCLRSDDGVQVRIDVLSWRGRGLRLFKVRHASVADEADVDEVALWLHVAARAGWPVHSAGLLLVDTDFMYPGHGCYSGLFREVDLGPVLGTRPVPDWLQSMRRCEKAALPVSEPGPCCTRGGGCDVIGRCGADLARTGGIAPGPASLHVVGRELAAELRDEGHADLRSVPEARLIDGRHRRARRAVLQDAPVREPGLAALMQGQGYPRHLLRIHTIGFAVPVWPGTRPYQVLPFQWSCDVFDAPGQRLRHGHLAGSAGDPRREFALTLLDAIGPHGPVFAYNAGFERNRLRELALRFDDLGPALEALLPRIVDLFQIARSHFYHPAQCGSWSFRSVFEAIAPDLQVDRFDSGGDPPLSPQAAFALTLQRGLDGTRRQQLRQALRELGRRQTEALARMVTLFEQPAD